MLRREGRKFMRTKTAVRLWQVTLVLVILALTVSAMMLGASADDLQWNLLTDTEAGYLLYDMHSAYVTGTEADGTPYVESQKSGGLYIYDDSNILGS